MAQPKTQRFGKFKVLVGDAATPEVFSTPCGFTSKAFNMKANTSSTQVPDCDNPDLPAWSQKDIQTIEASISGQGVLALDALKVWRDWFLSAAVKNVRIMFDDTLANKGGYYQGAAVLTELGHSVELGEKVKLSVSMENNGAFTWVDAAA